ncbi:DapH/DapD/GlmU-related protein [Paenibacillus beijingensis]|uniref:Serine acetyltransferase n=1 Tax=Paenibacillus beijingensis TaxID=1126833 RepID=A0A0D5NFQ8_9BACL|nr:DapH/DapD/GlmU-related protein [Paenibacillus beijingensis]AJY73985.1 hypothetical protein VN24_04345 [Paenibacillus beijingensis]
MKIICQCEIPAATKIGKGGYFEHGANGTIMNRGVVIGTNAHTYHQVTIGKVGKKDGCPVIGDNVFIGAGAKIIGKIKIGNNVRIGANCVVH